MANNTVPDSGQAEHRFIPGDRVRDTDEDEAVIVVNVPGTRAADHEIQALAGRTVAQENPTYSPTDPVIEVVYPDNVDYYAEKFSDTLGGWSARSLPELYQDGTLEEMPVTIYSMPASRLAADLEDA